MGIFSNTEPRTRCPPCCRLRADLWLPRWKVGYGYHPAHLGVCWGDFQRVDRKAGERGGVVHAPPRPLLPTHLPAGRRFGGQPPAVRAALRPEM